MASSPPETGSRPNDPTPRALDIEDNLTPSGPAHHGLAQKMPRRGEGSLRTTQKLTGSECRVTVAPHSVRKAPTASNPETLPDAFSTMGSGWESFILRMWCYGISTTTAIWRHSFPTSKPAASADMTGKAVFGDPFYPGGGCVLSTAVGDLNGNGCLDTFGAKIGRVPYRVLFEQPKIEREPEMTSGNEAPRNTRTD